MRTAYEVRRGRLQDAAAALAELDRESQMHSSTPAIIEALREEYRRSMKDSEHELRDLAGSASSLDERERQRVRRRLLITERDQVMRAFRQGTLGRKSLQQLLADIDARLLELETGSDAG